MARIVVLGAGLGGMAAAYELREALGKGHAIDVVGLGDRFSFTPSNPWLAVGWRTPDAITLPAGEYLGEDYYHAGGVPAVVNQLMGQGLIREEAMTVNGATIGDNCRAAQIEDERVIRPFDQPLINDAGFLVLSGNLFTSAIMKTSVISEEFRTRYLSNPDDPDAFEGPVIVFDGPEDYHARIDDPATGITPETLLFMRGAGPIGYPGAAEVVNMRAPSYLISAGVTALPCIGDGRQSGTSGSPSILNASPEAAAMGGLAILKTGDRVRIDLRKGTANMLLPDDELAALSVGASILGGLESSRLDQVLVRDEQLAVAVSASNSPFQRVGILSVTAVLRPGVEEDVTRAIDTYQWAAAQVEGMSGEAARLRPRQPGAPPCR